MNKAHQAYAAMQEFCDWMDRGEARATHAYDKFKDILALPSVGDGTPDAALAIGEHAFRAGYEACCDDVSHCRMVVSYPEQREKCLNKAWDAYEPPEHIKELS